MFDVEFMEAARRDEALRAIDFNLSEMIFEIEHREQSFIKRNGGGFDPKAVVELRTLKAAQTAIAEFYAGVRGVAREVAAANKKGGKDFHRMPFWIEATIDSLIAAFVHPITRGEAKLEHAGGIAGNEAAGDAGVAREPAA